MKLTKSGFISIMGCIVILAVILMTWYNDRPKSRSLSISENSNDDLNSGIDYLLDSTYKVVTDTLINIFKVETGDKVITLPLPNELINSIAMHPSGNYLVLLWEYSLEVYNLRSVRMADSDTTKSCFEELPGLDIVDMDYTEFSADGKYLMVINYGDVEVKIYQWPGLKYLATAYMGFRRNSFSWENDSGKLVFSYFENNYIYRTEFPSDLNSDTLFFSEPVMIDSIADLR